MSNPDISETEVQTHSAIIYVGTLDRSTGLNASAQDLEEVCQEYCDDVGLCVWVTEGKYIYTDGNEHGYAVHLMNYPRFPSTPEEVYGHARALGEKLLIAMRQQRISIKTEEKTVMLSNETRIANAPSN